MEIRNSTPFVAGLFIRLDVDGAERLAVALRATWAIAGNGSLMLATEQPPLLVADEYHGEPGMSSIRYEADLGPAKPATDIALVGFAVSPASSNEQVVALRVGPLAQRARVQRPRERQTAANGPAGSALARVPLVWELAAGGADSTPDDPQHHGIDLRNPIGRGFRAKHSKREGNLDAPWILVYDGDAGAPIGFGFIGPHWLPRNQYGGTYDEAWRNERCPLLPEDFDPRFFNSAAPGLTAPAHFVGGEPVEVYGCTPDGQLMFTLPSVDVNVAATLNGGAEPLPMAINTVTIDTDRMQLRICWRGELAIHKRVQQLQYVDITATGGGLPK